MKQPNIAKMDKPELFELLKTTTARINQLADLRPKTDEELLMLKRLKQNLRKKLFECGHCADASIGTRLDDNGEEEEYLKKDCKHEECLYHDYFYRLMLKDVKEDEKLKNKLRNL